MNIVANTAYLPTVSWFAALVASDDFLIDQHEHFVKSTTRNHAFIYGANGPLKLSVPILGGKDKRRTVRQVEMTADYDWRRIHWQSLCAAYRRSPFFEYYEDELYPLYQPSSNSLLDFNHQLTMKMIELIGIDKSVGFTKQYFKEEVDWLDIRTTRKTGVSEHFNLSRDHYPRYIQVFESNHGFFPNLSIVDLLFAEGPATLQYLDKIASNMQG